MRTTRSSRQARAERLARMEAGLQDEIRRFNTAVAGSGRYPTEETAFGPYAVVRARYGINGGVDIVCRAIGEGGSLSPYDRTFMLANDDRWARLLELAGVERHPDAADRRALPW